jgi:hypothetical protein
MLPFLWHILYLFNNNHVLGTCISKEGLYSIFVIHPQLISLVLLPLIVGTFVEYAAKKIIFPGANKSFILFFLLSWYFLPLLINWALTKLNVATVYSPRYLSWIIPAPIIGSALLISAFQSKWSKFAYIFTLLVLATQFYIKDILTIIVTERNQNETAKYESNGNPDFDWKEAVSKINSSGLLTDKIFVISGLVEYQNLNKKGHEKVELANYLLSTVNSMYKLQKEYLEKAEPKGSILEIPDSASNYIVVGPSALTRDLIKTSEYRKNSQIGTEISPFLAPIVIYYKMN